MISTPAKPSPVSGAPGAAVPPGRVARIPAAPLLLLLAAGLLVARWLTRSRYLFDLDSILYVRALDHYDLRLLQPPLPGYYLYIQLGRLVRALFSLAGVREGNLVFVAISALFGLLIVAALYALAMELFEDRRTGLIAAALALTGPIFWYQSSIASPRIAEGFFATLIAYLGVRLRRRGEAWTFWLLPVALAVAAGVRQQSFFYLLPFCVWATWQTPWRLRLAAAALLALGLAAWLAPMCQASGGLAEVRRLSRDYWQGWVVNGTGVFYAPTVPEALRRFAKNAFSVAVYALFTGPLALLFLPALLRGTQRLRLGSLPGQALLLALVPVLLFFAFIHILQIGHFLTAAPFLALLCARALAGLPAAPTATALVVLTNLAFVFFYPARLIGERIGTPTVAAIRARDRFVGSSTAAVRRHAGPPEQVLLVTTSLAYGFIETYLPGYRFYLIPGLLESAGGGAESRNQEVLTNNRIPVATGLRRGPGRVAAPPEARALVTFSYENDLAKLLDERSAAGAERPVPDLPALAIVRRGAPFELRFGPGRLALISPGERER